MSLESEILDVLALSSAVTILTGSRLRFEWPDQDTEIPAVVLTRVGGGRESALASANYFEDALLQLDCFADTYATVKALAAAVKAALHGYTGSAGSFTIAGVYLRNETDLSEKDGDFERRRVSLDFSVSFF